MRTDCRSTSSSRLARRTSRRFWTSCSKPPTKRLLDEEGERIAWPFAIGGDKGYRADWIDQYLLDLGIEPVIPSKENENRVARPVEFDRGAYRRRNIVERLIGWLKESRRIFSRFEKTAKNFGGMITLAFIRQYLTYKLV